MTNRTCSVEDCEKDVRTNGLCYAHYMKAWRYGTPTPQHAPRWVDLRGRRFGMLTVQARDRGAWRCACDCGATHTVLAGDLNRGSVASCGNHRRQDVVEYYAAHAHVRQDRGPASDHKCIDCGRGAQQWSYDHADPDEQTSQARDVVGIAYSLDSDHYDPRCVSCHKRFDLGRINAHR